MTSALPALATAKKPSRVWQASLQLDFARRGQPSRKNTKIVRNRHYGPLRVLKPFYPEGEVCHSYLIHPPGGLVLGDELNIDITVQPQAHALVTTPSAGKVYTTGSHDEQQQQNVSLTAEPNACLEWLPQETLIFNGANAKLNTTAYLHTGSQLALWDIVCFGRPASKLPFEQGRCQQNITIYQDSIPILIERNVIEAGSPIMSSSWGLNGKNSMGTFVLTAHTKRNEREEILQSLAAKYGSSHLWGITQKDALCIARYLGDSASVCRHGFEIIWQALRPSLCQRPACIPRIWLT